MTHSCTYASGECLQLCGDTGMYMLQFMDCEPEYRACFLDLLRALHNTRRKALTQKEATDACDSLDAALAKMERKMPLFWNTFTRHSLLHIRDNLMRAGSFWAHNMLMFERFHTVLKKCARSSRNMLRSIAQNYTILERSQTTWRHMYNDWAVKSLASSIGNQVKFECGVPEALGIVKPLGQQRLSELDDSLFLQVLDTWTTVDLHFGVFFRRYREHRRDTATPPSFSDWVPRSRTERQKLYQQVLLLCACLWACVLLCTSVAMIHDTHS